MDKENVLHLDSGVYQLLITMTAGNLNSIDGTRKQNIIGEVTQTQEDKHGIYSLIRRY